MLVLSRRTAETIVIPELGISVEVLQVKGKTVRLGIKAPDSVRILRGELDEIRKGFELPIQNVEASCGSESNSSAKELALSVA